MRVGIPRQRVACYARLDNKSIRMPGTESESSQFKIFRVSGRCQSAAASNSISRSRLSRYESWGLRQKIFLEKEDYETFVKTIGEIHERWGVEFLAYCLMGNHYHICLRTPEGNLSRVMRHLDGLYTQRFNRIDRCDSKEQRARLSACAYSWWE